MLTTHSLFLLRELSIQLADKKNRGVDRRFFGLQTPQIAGTGVRVSAADELNQLEHIASLDAETEQADRYLSLVPNLFAEE